LRGLSSDTFTAKDFRTWGGTVAAAEALYATGPSSDPKAVEAALRQAVKVAAARLGNSATVCRQYYVHPAILADYAAGSLCTRIEKAASSRRAEPFALDAVEAAVYAVLKADASRP
jgi:DNA topoisomerase-1